MALMEVPEIQLLTRLFYHPPSAVGVNVVRFLVFDYDDSHYSVLEQYFGSLHYEMMTHPTSKSACFLSGFSFEGALHEEAVRQNIVEFRPHYIILNVNLPEDYETVRSLMLYASEWVEEGRFIVTSEEEPLTPMVWFPSESEVILDYLKFMILPEEPIM